MWRSAWRIWRWARLLHLRRNLKYFCDYQWNRFVNIVCCTVVNCVYHVICICLIGFQINKKNWSTKQIVLVMNIKLFSAETQPHRIDNPSDLFVQQSVADHHSLHITAELSAGAFIHFYRASITRVIFTNPFSLFTPFPTCIVDDAVYTTII